VSARRAAALLHRCLSACRASRAPHRGIARRSTSWIADVELLGAYRGLTLASDALDALVEWYVSYATDRAPADSIIAEYRRKMCNADNAR